MSPEWFLQVSLQQQHVNDVTMRMMTVIRMSNDEDGDDDNSAQKQSRCVYVKCVSCCGLLVLLGRGHTWSRIIITV